MRYVPHFYAKALAAVIASPAANGDVIVRNFMSLLARNGDEGQARKILEEAARFARGAERIRKIVVESARPLMASQWDMVGAFLRPTDVVEEEIVPELVAGIRIFIDDETCFDGSLKGKLDLLFGGA